MNPSDIGRLNGSIEKFSIRPEPALSVPRQT